MIAPERVARLVAGDDRAFASMRPGHDRPGKMFLLTKARFYDLLQ